ncbi:Hypothetical protein A7982_01231 [Minicystis rosea]|nr:Hypothetical protein A7982_01231 [Minicystis rosea]
MYGTILALPFIHEHGIAVSAVELAIEKAPDGNVIQPGKVIGR